MKKNVGLLVLVVLVLFIWVFFTGGGQKPAKPEAKKPLKAAFIYDGPISDLGWTYEHERGRKMLEAKFGDKVKTSFMETIPKRGLNRLWKVFRCKLHAGGRLQQRMNKIPACRLCCKKSFGLKTQKGSVAKNSSGHNPW